MERISEIILQQQWKETDRTKQNGSLVILKSEQRYLLGIMNRNKMGSYHQ